MHNYNTLLRWHWRKFAINDETTIHKYTIMHRPCSIRTDILAWHHMMYERMNLPTPTKFNLKIHKEKKERKSMGFAFSCLCSRVKKTNYKFVPNVFDNNTLKVKSPKLHSPCISVELVLVGFFGSSFICSELLKVFIPSNALRQIS